MTALAYDHAVKRLDELMKKSALKQQDRKELELLLDRMDDYDGLACLKAGAA